jgi:hypothetical protein
VQARSARKWTLALPGVLAFTLALCPIAARADEPAKTEGRDNVLFYCSFNDTVHPTIQQGDKGVEPHGTVEFVKGFMGKAVLTGHSRFLVYPLKGNINITEGTIKFWVMPADWKIGDGQFHHFFRIVGQQPEGVKDARPFDLILYKYSEWDDIVAYGMNGELTGAGMPQIPMDSSWAPKRWHQVAFTWNNQGASLYVDGVGKDRKYVHEPPNMFPSGSFLIGGPYFAENKTLTAINELYIYNRKLSAEEIGQMYKKELVEGVMKR